MRSCQALLLHRFLHLQWPEQKEAGKRVGKEQERVGDHEMRGLAMPKVG